MTEFYNFRNQIMNDLHKATANRTLDFNKRKFSISFIKYDDTYDSDLEYQIRKIKYSNQKYIIDFTSNRNQYEMDGDDEIYTFFLDDLINILFYIIKFSNYKKFGYDEITVNYTENHEDFESILYL